MEIKQSRGSNFASLGGVLLLLAAVILTGYFGFTRIAGYLLLFLILCAGALFWSFFVLRKLRAQIRPRQETCFPEEEIEVELTVENNSRLAAVWTDVWIPLEREACISSLNYPVNGFLVIENAGLLPERRSGSPPIRTKGEEDPQVPAQEGDKESPIASEETKREERQGICQRFAWIRGKQRLSCGLHFRAERRGVYRADQIYLQAGDGFGMMVRGKTQPLTETAEVTVYPKIYPLAEELLWDTLRVSEQEGDGFYEDVTILKNVRTYENRDSFRSINWRMLAKQDELWTNLYETKAPEGVCLLLDLQSFRERKMEVTPSGEKPVYVVCREELEKKISLAASVFWELIGRGVGCSLLLPGYAGQKMRLITGSAGDLAKRSLLGALAQIDYRGERTDWQEEHLASYGAGTGRLYVLSAGGKEASFAPAEMALGQKGVRL